MTLLLMAAGSGSRYGKLKQFDDLGPAGEFLMEFAIYDATKNGVNHIVVITKKDKLKFLEDHLKSRLPKNVKLDVIAQKLTDLPEGVTFNGERSKPWGTAHAVWSARHVIDAPFCVINADDFYGQSAYENAINFIKKHLKEDYYALVGYTLKDTLSDNGPVSRGVCKTADTHLISIDERLKLELQGNKVVDADSGMEYSGDELASMNFWVCRTAIFKVIENEFRAFLQDDHLIKTSELYIPKTIQHLLQLGEAKVKVVPSTDRWFGVTYASDREIAVNKLQQMTANGKYPSPLWK